MYQDMMFLELLNSESPVDPSEGGPASKMARTPKVKKMVKHVYCEICGWENFLYRQVWDGERWSLERIRPVVPRTYQCGHPLDVDDEEDANNCGTRIVSKEAPFSASCPMQNGERRMNNIPV